MDKEFREEPITYVFGFPYVVYCAISCGHDLCVYDYIIWFKLSNNNTYDRLLSKVGWVPGWLDGLLVTKICGDRYLYIHCSVTW